MNAAATADLLERALSITFEMAAPMLFAGLAVGFLVALFQAATQIQEVTLVFIPKMLAVGLALWFAAPWIFDSFERLFGEVLVNLRMAAGG